MDNKSLNSILADKKAEIAEIENMIKTAKKLGISLEVGTKVTITSKAKAPKAAVKKTKKNKFMFSQKEFKKMRQMISNLASTATNVTPKAVRAILRKEFPKVQLKHIYNILWTMAKEGKLNRVSSGVYQSA